MNVLTLLPLLAALLATTHARTQDFALSSVGTHVEYDHAHAPRPAAVSVKGASLAPGTIAPMHRPAKAAAVAAAHDDAEQETDEAEEAEEAEEEEETEKTPAPKGASARAAPLHASTTKVIVTRRRSGSRSAAPTSTETTEEEEESSSDSDEAEDDDAAAASGDDAPAAVNKKEVAAARDAAAASRDPRPRDPAMVLIPHHTIAIDVQTTNVAMRQPAGTTKRTTTTTATTTASSTTALSSNSFYAGEVFALFNPHKRTRLTVRPHGVRRRLKLKTTRCNIAQPLSADSNLAFYWIPAGDNNLAHLATRVDGRELCATHQHTGTRFYPCGPKSTRYSLGATQKKGTFKVRDAARASRCMDAEFHHALRMKPCGAFRDQGWMKLHIAFRK